MRRFRWTPHPVIVTIGDNIGIILGSFYTPVFPLLEGGGSSYEKIFVG